MPKWSTKDTIETLNRLSSESKALELALLSAVAAVENGEEIDTADAILLAGKIAAFNETASKARFDIAVFTWGSKNSSDSPLVSDNHNLTTQLILRWTYWQNTWNKFYQRYSAE